MRPKTMYRNKQIDNLWIYVNYVISTEPKGQMINGTWWRRDDSTGKFINTQIDQEVFIPNKEDIWDPIDEGKY